MERNHDVTAILEDLSSGRQEAADELFVVVYEELRGIARSFMVRERPDHTLQTTAVVHEAYIRLLGGGAPRWENRAHFFSTAAEAMRRILVEHARRKVSLKRGGERKRVDLGDPAGSVPAPEDLLALDDALNRLESRDEVMAEVVKLRHFAGLTVEETADVLGISPRSVNRSWTGARAWLRLELDSATPAGET